MSEKVVSVQRNIRVIYPTADGCVEMHQPTNSVPWGTQAERAVGEVTGGRAGSIDRRLTVPGEETLTYLMEPAPGVDLAAEFDHTQCGHDPELLAVLVALRKKFVS